VEAAWWAKHAVCEAFKQTSKFMNFRFVSHVDVEQKIHRFRRIFEFLLGLLVDV
jgi:hypothetical protein